MTAWTVAHQAPLSMGFSKLPFPSPGDLPDSGMFEPVSPVSSTLQADSLSAEPLRKPYILYEREREMSLYIWKYNILYNTKHTQQNKHFPGGASGKEPNCQCRTYKKHGLDLWVGKIPWSRAWQSTRVVLPGESHGQRTLLGYSPWCCRVRHN